MNSSTWILLLLGFQFCTAPVFAAARETSERICALTLQPPIVQGNTPPYEFRFQGPRSETRFYRDGTVWEYTNSTWVVIGTGTVVKERVILERGLPNLTPVSSYEHTRNILNESRYYPNVKSNFASMVHQLKVGTHLVEVVIPQLPGMEGLADGIVRTITSLPLKRFESLKTVRVNTRTNVGDAYWQKTYKNFTRSAATGGGNGEMDIYGVSLDHFRNADNEAQRITRHEFGHTIATNIFGSANPDRSYVDIASRDAYSVSTYGNNSWAEDFAEGVEIYLRTNAGQFSPSVRTNLRARFAFFDDVFSYRKPQSVSVDSQSEKAVEHIEVFVNMIGGSRILVLSPTIGVGMLLDLDQN